MCGAATTFKSPCVGSCTSISIMVTHCHSTAAGSPPRKSVYNMHLHSPQQRHAPQAEGGQLAVAARVVPLLPVLPVGHAEVRDVVDHCQALEELTFILNLQRCTAKWKKWLCNRMQEVQSCFTRLPVYWQMTS